MRTVALAQELGAASADTESAMASAALNFSTRLCWEEEGRLLWARKPLNADSIGVTSTEQASTRPAAVPADIAISSLVGISSSSDVSARAVCQGWRKASCMITATTADIVVGFVGRAISR